MLTTTCTSALQVKTWAVHTRNVLHPSSRLARVGSVSPRLVGRFIQDESSTTSFDWTSHFERIDPARFHDDDDDSMTIPVMPLSRVKVPTDTVQLNVFEPRYRTMMRLVKRSQSRVFGVTLRVQNGVSSVGVLCELTHYVPVTSRRSIFVSARAIGRFEVKEVVHAKPFLCVKARTVYDQALSSGSESEIWSAMEGVRALVESLTGSLENSEAFTLEVRRFSPNPEVARTVVGATSSDPNMLAACRRAGLMGDTKEPAPVTSVSRESLHCEETALAFIPSEARMDECERAVRRAEKHSFALARSLELDDDILLEMLLMRCTDERLSRCGAVIRDSERYLRARSAIKQLELDE